MEELRQTRSLFKDGSKSAEEPFEGSSTFDYNEDKGWGYTTSQIASIFILEAMAISESLTCINKIQDRNFSIFSDSRSVTAISSSKSFGKRSLLIYRIKEQLEETKAVGKHVEIHWIPAHGGITRNKKANELAKDRKIPIPAKDMKSLWGKESE
jgi:ribonuclease HI